MALWKRILLGLAFLAYGTIIAYLIPRHEPWVDEAQAWQLAGNLHLSSLFKTYLHYEVSPGLWHFMLWVLVRLHVSYAGLHWFSAFIALVGVVILTIASPFPFLVRLCLPFTYYFAYQYSIVARSYILIPPLLFLLTWSWPQRRSWPLWIALLLGLLANVSAHALVMAVGFALVLAIEWWPLRKQNIRIWLAASTLFLLLSCFAVWCLVPPHDAEWVSGAKTMTSSASRTALLESLPDRGPFAFKWLPVDERLTVLLALRFFIILPSGFADHYRFGFIAWALLFWQWKRKRTLRYLLPVLLTAGFCTVTRFSPYHAGLLWVLFLSLWWLTISEKRSDWLHIATLVTVMICVLSQMIWTKQAFEYDTRHPYSPDRDAAVVLQGYIDHGEKVDVAIRPRQPISERVEFYVTGLEPYFSTEPFGNMRRRFWIWDQDESMRATYLKDTAERSVVVMMEQTPPGTFMQQEEDRLQSLNYRKQHTICGRIYYPREMNRVMCHVFYEVAH